MWMEIPISLVKQSTTNISAILDTQRCVVGRVRRATGTLIADDQIITNVAWSYETPKPDAEAIRYRVAFYSGKGIIIFW